MATLVNYTSVRFSSVLFSQNALRYKNTYKHFKLAREPRRNQKAYEAWAPESQRNKESENSRTVMH